MYLLIAATLALTSLALAQGPTATDNGLRAHVKQCVEHVVYSNLDSPSSSFTYKYSPEGLLLEQQSQYGSGSTILASYSYASGRLVRVTRTTMDPHISDPHTEVTYAYDAAGRLLSVTSGSDKYQTYEYDAQGRKRLIQQFPVIEDPNVVLGGFTWENGAYTITPISGGTLTTIYDDHDRPIEARVQDANGKLTQHIVRRYDEQGHILGDQLSSENMQSHLPADLGVQLNAQQRQAVAKFISGAFGSGQSTYKYDAQGRLIEKSVTTGSFGTQITTYKHDEHGNVTDEETVSTPGPAKYSEYGMNEDGWMAVTSVKHGAMASSRSSVRYAYEYDSQDNWIQKTESRREGEGQYAVTATTYRSLTYY